MNEAEQARLRALDAALVWETPSEPRFDDIAMLAATVGQARIGLVSFVGRERQWFKARHGTQIPGTPRELSLCDEVVRTGAPVVAEDLRTDPRFREHPLLSADPRIGFYAGYPVWFDGHVLGTVCIVDEEPRPVTPAQREGLRALAAQVEALLELRLRVARSEAREGERLELRTQQLLHADRLILLGTLAGAVGHELNNVAQVMTSSLELVAESARQGAPADGEDLQTMKAATGHLQAHARQLLTLARPGPDRLERLDLRIVVEGAVQFLRAASRLHGVRVETDLPPTPLWACANRIRLEQVMLNLVGNAIDAVHAEPEPRRRVRVRVRARDLSDDVCPAASCEVTDTGSGMSPEVEAQIFTPYFTTKGPERGTGLGLVVVRQIIESYGGTVSCRSVLGEGTTFTFDLPLQRAASLRG